jgi:methylase of polypeptide subunit release factors
VGGYRVEVGVMTATIDAPTLHPTPSPLRTEPAAAIDTVRSALTESGFDERAICIRLGIESLDTFCAIRDGRADVAPADALDVLIRYFLDNEPLAWSVADALLPSGTVEAMRAVGLLRNHRDDPSAGVSNVLLYPTQSLFIASDVAALPDGEGARWWDLVYAAITTNTQNFLATMDRSRCEAFLDLCSGTGVAALAAASTFSDHAWAIDVAERSTDFARFNARLNGILNFTALTGDLYEPVAGRTFDKIVAHPPYVPSRETVMAYRDGGSDGEGVTRRIIAGLPEFLRPGGVFHCTCTATDRRDAPLEQRLRAMLGPAEGEFDIAIVVTNEFDPTEYYVRLAIAGRGTWAEAEEWHHHFAALGVTKMVYATIEIVRHASTHAPFTVRRRVGSATGARELGHLVRARELSASAEAFERLIASRPLVPAHVSLHSDHAREAQGWTMRKCTLSTDVPFDVRLPCPPEMVAFVGRMDGTRTVRELFDDAGREGTLDETATIERLASYIHLLASHGLVEF